MRPGRRLVGGHSEDALYDFHCDYYYPFSICKRSIVHNRDEGMLDIWHEQSLIGIQDICKSHAYRRHHLLLKSYCRSPLASVPISIPIVKFTSYHVLLAQCEAIPPNATIPLFLNNHILPQYFALGGGAYPPRLS